MNLEKYTLDVDEIASTGHCRKGLSLEARHSISIENARKRRSSLTASIFIPKQVVKSQNSPRTPLPTSSKKLLQQVAISNDRPNQNLNLETPQDADNAILHNPRMDKNHRFEGNQTDQQEAQLSKISKHKWKQQNYVRAKMWLPPTNPKDKELLSDRSIEDELKSMGLEISSDTELFENSLAKRQAMPSNSSNSTDDIVKSLILNEAKIDTKKFSQTPKSVQEHRNRKSFRKPSKTQSWVKKKRNDFEIATPNVSKEQSRVKKKRNDTEIPTQNRGSITFSKKLAKMSVDNQECEKYCNSLHAVKEFQDVLQTIISNSTSKIDLEIKLYLMQLQNTINEFSEFLFKTYKNLELFEVLGSARQFNQNSDTTQPTNTTQPAAEFIVRIDVPNMMEQILTFNTREILQHTIENNENADRMQQKRESIKTRNLEKSTKRNTAVHSNSVEQPACQNQSPAQSKMPIEKSQTTNPAFRNQSVHAEQEPTYAEECTEPTTTLYRPYTNHTQETQKYSARNPPYTNNSPLAGQWNPEPATHPAFRNPTALTDSKLSPTQHSRLPRQGQMQASNSPSPSATNLNPTLQEVASKLKYPHNTKHPLTSASAENYCPHSDNLLRPTDQSPPFHIPYPVAQQITPSDSRVFFAVPHSSNSNPLLTPPQSIECQSLPNYRPPPPCYPYPGYTQNAIFTTTPPSEDIRNEATIHQHQPPPIFLPALEVCCQDRWPYIYKDREDLSYLSYLNSALTAPGLFPKAYGEF